MPAMNIHVAAAVAKLCILYRGLCTKDKVTECTLPLTHLFYEASIGTGVYFLWLNVHRLGKL